MKQTKEAIIGKELMIQNLWKQDNLVSSCHRCGKQFNLLIRRKHHCRRCGNIFCQDCSNYFFNGQGITKEKRIRLCIKCYDYLNKLISSYGYIITDDQSITMKIETPSKNHSRNTSKYEKPLNLSQQLQMEEEEEGQENNLEEDTLMNATDYLDNKIEDEQQLFQQLKEKLMPYLQEKGKIQLGKICEQLLIKLLHNSKQIDKKIDHWKKIITDYIIQCVNDLQFQALNLAPMDINCFVKVKLISYKNDAAGYFKGVIFRKNVALKQMNTNIKDARILIIKGDFDTKNTEKIDDYIKNEKKILITIIDKIIYEYKPNIIFVEKNSNKIALDHCLTNEITVVTNVKQKVLQRIQICTGAKPLKLDLLDKFIIEKKARIGECINIYFKNCPKIQSQDKKDEITIVKDQTLCFLEVKDAKKFATIYFSDPSDEILNVLKQCFIGCVRLGKHQDLESKLILTEHLMLTDKLANQQDNSIMQTKSYYTKYYSSIGDLSNFLFEKVPLSDIFCMDISFIRVNFVLADVYNFNDIKTQKSLEKYREMHIPFGNTNNFSVAKICNFPQEKTSTYQSNEDVCLGIYIMLKILNRDIKCEHCRKPKIEHSSIYYCGKKYVKISLEYLIKQGNNRENRQISTDLVPPTLQGQISQSSQFSHVSNLSDDDNQITNKIITQKNIKNILEDAAKKNDEKRTRVYTYIRCPRCEERSKQVKLSNENLEYSFLRLLQQFTTNQTNSIQNFIFQQNISSQNTKCDKHQPERVYVYDDTLMILNIGDVIIYQQDYLKITQTTLQSIERWEESYLKKQTDELKKQFNQIDSKLQLLQQSEYSQSFHKEYEQLNQQNTFSDISTLQEYIYFIGNLLLRIHSTFIEQKKNDLKKFTQSSRLEPSLFLPKSSESSIKELQTPKTSKDLQNVFNIPDKNRRYSIRYPELLRQSQDIGSAICEENESDSILSNIIEIKSPLGGKPKESMTSTIQSSKDLDNQEQKYSDINLTKEWSFSSFINEQSKIKDQEKIIQFTPIYLHQPLSQVSFALNHPELLNLIQYNKNFKNAQQCDLLKFLSQKIDQKTNQEDLLQESSNNKPNLSGSDQQSLQNVKKEKNYINIKIPYDIEQKGLKSSYSRDQLLNEQNSIQSLKQTQILQNNQGPSQLIKKSKNLEILIYFPNHFEALRILCGIDLKLFIKSLSASTNWNASGGKSASKFFKTSNDLFVIKKFEEEKEFRMFEQFALDYFLQFKKHFESEKPSLLSKILGMYEIRDKNGPEYYLVMENLFFGMGDSQDLSVYDLKGSETNRWEQRENKVLLDTNFVLDRNGEPLCLAKEYFRYNDRAFQNDTKFLQKKQIIDYSLLLIIDKKQKKIRMGIIDYLRFYTWDKMSEHQLKKLLKGGKIPTIVNPDDYKSRFTNALRQYFIHD